MKTGMAVLAATLALGGSVFWAQTHTQTGGTEAQSSATCSLDRSQMQDEVKELHDYTIRMESRILMIRNSAGVVQNPQLRNALQIDADMWQDHDDQVKKRIALLEAAIHRCQR